MSHPVEVVTFHLGQQQQARILSKRREARAGFTAAAVAAGASAVAMAGFAAITWAAGFVLHTPIFAASWMIVTGLVGSHAYRKARERTRRYHIGARMDADAFSGIELDLVRGNKRGGYDLAVAPGMSGYLQEGRNSRPLEALVVGQSPRGVPLSPGMVARVEQGQTTFVVRCLEESDDASEEDVPAVRALELPGLGVRRFVRDAAMAAPAAAFVCLLAATTPVPVSVSEADMLSRIPATATPYQAELHLRRQAQMQAQTLHSCFEGLPLSCHRKGYVGVGLRLDGNGEVQKSWVARSTYGNDCPVTTCMESIIANWYFEPIHEPMSVVIPVQVLETRRPRTLSFVPVKLARDGDTALPVLDDCL